MVKEVDYKALAEKNKKIREYGEFRKDVKEVSEKGGGAATFEEDYRKQSGGSKNKIYTHGLVYLDEQIKSNLPAAYYSFNSLRSHLEKEDPTEFEKFKKALAKRGYRIVKKAQEKHEFNKDNENILDYCEEHLGNKSSGLEKAITVISLGSIVLGIAIGYPALTGNAIADVVKGSVGYGAALFFLGLLGVFIANKK